MVIKTNLPTLYNDKTPLTKECILKWTIVVFLSIGMLMACGGHRITQTESTSGESVSHDVETNDIYNKIKSKIQDARQDGFINCGVYDKPECRIYQEKFKTIAVETIIESQGADSLICCVTRISLQKKEQNCADLSEYAEQLNSSCPKGWWEIKP